MNRPATTVTEWLTWTDTIPQHNATDRHDWACDEPSPTSATGRDPDGAMWEESTRRSFERFAA